MWLFVVNLGIAFAAGLYESRIVIPQWFDASSAGYQWNGEAARQADIGLRFWVYVTTVPLTLLSVANLIAAWQASGAARRWWLAAAVTATRKSVHVFLFHSTMIYLMRDENLPRGKATSSALQWVNLNYLRHVISLIAWLAALKAFSLAHQSRADYDGQRF